MTVCKRYFRKFIRLNIGFMIIAMYIFTSKQAMCLSPWDVLNDGFSVVTGLTLGQSGIAVGCIILFIDVISGEKLGFGSILNAIFIGLFTDLLMYLNGIICFFPRIESMPWQIFFCAVAQLLRGLGTYFYMRAEMGAGPRDTLSLFLSRKTRIPLGFCSLGAEIIAGLAGWAMGGEVGIGTFVSMFLGGPMIQLVFSIFKYDSSKIHNESFSDTFKIIRQSRRA